MSKLQQHKIRQIVETTIRRYLREAVDNVFSIDDLNNINSFKEKYYYCKEHLGKHIGRGSSRAVFQIDDEKCLKLAWNEKGVAQNEFECEPYKQTFDIFPHVFEHADDYSWIICEYVLPATSQDFKHCLNMSFEEFCDVIRSIYNCYADRRRPSYAPYSRDEIGEMIDKSQFFSDLYDYMSNYRLYPGDFMRKVNWGLTQRDGDAVLVNLDNGLSNDVWQNFYKR